MKKALIVTSLIVMLALTLTPTAKAFSINLGNIFHTEKTEQSDKDKTEKCKELSHGDLVEEEHESSTAKLHENDDNKNEDCASPSPTPTVVDIATPTPTATPSDILPTATPMAEASATPTETPSSSPTASPLGLNENQGVNGLIAQIKLLIQNFLNSIQGQNH